MVLPPKLLWLWESRFIEIIRITYEITFAYSNFRIAALPIAPAEQPVPQHEFCENFGNVILVAGQIRPKPTPGQTVSCCAG